jgi:hypothetical protein
MLIDFLPRAATQKARVSAACPAFLADLPVG